MFYNVLSFVRGSVTNNCGFLVLIVGLLDVTNTFSLGYHISHIQLFLDTESLTVVCVLHFSSVLR
jgi:hypothetical protein